MLEIYTTKNCNQCPIVISALVQKGVDFEKVDAEESPDKAADHMIMSVPTIVDHAGDTHVGTGACLEFINNADL